MKTVFLILSLAILMSSGVMFFLVKKGAALRPAGVIAPAEIAAKPELVAESIALRLFPEFQKVKNVIWHFDIQDKPFSEIAEMTLQKYQTIPKPELIDLRKNPEAKCETNCWYIQSLNQPINSYVVDKIENAPSLEIYVQSFERDEEVTVFCENEKILEFKCIRPISIRQVKKKFKKSRPYFFMRRYMDSQFYLFIEKAK